MKRILAILVVLAAGLAHAAQMGICITNITCTADGLAVDWVTDLPPPYRAAVHIPAEVGLIRAWPVEYVDTDQCHAVITGKFYDVAVFVQVYQPNDRLCPPMRTRKMRPMEWTSYVSRVHRTPVRSVVGTQRWSDCPPNMDLGGVDPEVMSIEPDGSWSAFVHTNATEMSFTLRALNRQIPGSSAYETNFVERTFAVRGRPEGVGTGFRVVATPLADGEFDVEIAVAYSAKTNMSQAVLVKRGWKSLSASGDRWKFSTDWEGAPIMVPCPNAVPYRIYWDGL